MADEFWPTGEMAITEESRRNLEKNFLRCCFTRHESHLNSRGIDLFNLFDVRSVLFWDFAA
jgi:hypothetical protein